MRKSSLSLGVAVLSSLFYVPAFADPPAFGDPLRGLTVAQLERFTLGKDEFTAEEDNDDGLGPVFNETSCSTCHTGPGNAVGGTNQRLETRFGTTTNGKFDPLAQLGGSLLQDHGIGLVTVAAGTHTFNPETVPASATIRTSRRTTPLFGLGLVDAVPDNTFRFLAAVESQYGSGIAGKVHMVDDPVHGGKSVGKFGWKAQVPNLMTFSGDAYLNEMGISNPLFPNENCPQGDCSALAFNPALFSPNDNGSGVRAFNDFMTMLAPPPRGPITLDVVVGDVVFRAIGCTACHTPVLVTGPSDIAALNHKAFEPFSDFLLHDMGSLGDGIVQGDAGGRDIRTAPRWGLRTQTRLLHDGRAATVTDAILAHAGQGAAARDRFAALHPDLKAKLLAFLNSL
ncbi:MAG: di-heme oxidoredictase family protein [Thermoanaerobaculia bacterium]